MKLEGWGGTDKGKKKKKQKEILALINKFLLNFPDAHLEHSQFLPCVLMIYSGQPWPRKQFHKNVYHLLRHIEKCATLCCKTEQLIRGSLFCSQDQFDRGAYSWADLKYVNLLISLVPVKIRLIPGA